MEGEGGGTGQPLRTRDNQHPPHSALVGVRRTPGNKGRDFFLLNGPHVALNNLVQQFSRYSYIGDAQFAHMDCAVTEI